MKNNLFSFATSELSQDAFICWLLSFALERHKDEEPELTKCANNLVELFIGRTAEIREIKRQYKKIDVLVCIDNDEYIIIEDKTFSSQHGDQINRYADRLVKDDNIPREKIYSVYYKIIEQAHREVDAKNVTRTQLLELFKEYVDKVDNQIFIDYYNHLCTIDKGVSAYLDMNVDISDWWKHCRYAYIGFFTHLIEDKIIDISEPADYWWGHVNNPTGGFWCLCWYFLRGELEVSGLHEAGVSELYLQFENNKIAVKMACRDNVVDSTKIRQSIFEYTKQLLNVDKEIVKKKPFRRGKSMTVCYVEYDMKDYREKLKSMQSVMDSIAEGKYVYP